MKLPVQSARAYGESLQGGERAAGIIRAMSLPVPPAGPCLQSRCGGAFALWWRRQSPARQDRLATLGPLISVLLFLAAIIAAFWYLRNEEIDREMESVKRDTEIAQLALRLLIDNQEQLVRLPARW